METKLYIVKIGGAVIENDQALHKILVAFRGLKGHKILIHGGGKLATDLGVKLGIESQMINGRRVTNKETLELITMVYGGLINKKIVAKLQASNCNALGLSGADANCIQADVRPKKPMDFGFVGDVKKVNGKQIIRFLKDGLTPVFSAISHDLKGQLLNTNADTIAAEIAIAMSEFYDTRLIYCFEKKGVLLDMHDEQSLITDLNESNFKTYKAKGLIIDGMLPKLENCFYALKSNVNEVYIGQYHMLSDAKAAHTKITL